MGEFHSDLAIHLFSLAGGSAGNHTVTGIKVGDKIRTVMEVTNHADLTDEFTVTADNTINNTGGTDTTGDDLHVLYISSSPYGKSLVDPADM